MSYFAHKRLITVHDSLFILIVFKVRNHIIVLNSASFSVGERPFQTVADFNPRPVILRGDQQQNSVI